MNYGQFRVPDVALTLTPLTSAAPEPTWAIRPTRIFQLKVTADDATAWATSATSHIDDIESQFITNVGDYFFL